MIQPATRPNDAASQGITTMKSMYLAFLVIAVLAVAADYGLHRAGFSAQDMTSGPAVRLD